MEITRGSLDDISRPGSSEHTGSRVSSVSVPYDDRICPTAPFALVVLTKDTADIQIQSSSEDSVTNPSEEGYCHIGMSEEEKKDSKLQEAIEEMRRLDDILAAQLSKEKEVECQRKELQAKLWQDFLHNKPEGHSECAQETVNTRLFLGLEEASGEHDENPPRSAASLTPPPHGTEEQGNYVHVFETQVPDCDQDSQDLLKSKKKPSGPTESFDVGFEEAGGEQIGSSHCSSSKGKKKKDFVKRNIELVSGEELLTQQQRERLAKLLREIDEEEEESVTEGDSQEMLNVSVPTGQGYTPDPSELEQLMEIDSKLRLLRPASEFLSVQSSCTYFSVSRGRGTKVAWNHDGDPQPGEGAPWDIERRGLEGQLRKVDQQLESLRQGQDTTDPSPDLTEEQLVSLLEECKLTESWCQDAEINDPAS